MDHMVQEPYYQAKITQKLFIHIQIPPTGCMGLILRSTAVATTSHGTVEDTLRVLCSYCMHSSFSAFCYSNNNNNNNVIYIAPFTMCSRRLEESRKKMRFKFVFEPVHMIDSTDTARQPIPKMRPSHRKGTIARLFFGTRDLKCNGQKYQSTLIVPPTVLRLTVATVVLRNMRPT